jgi:DNA polymerase I-like protein with 3'-5' exonuclease and polymerase domains
VSYVQPPLFAPESSWRPAPVASLPSWAVAKRIAIDIETRDPDLTTLGPGVRRGGYIVGISFAIEDGPAAYLPVAHAGGDNLPAVSVWDYLRDQAASFSGIIVGANIIYDLDFLAEAGIHFKKASFFRDVQVAEPLLDELQDRYALDEIASRWGLPGKDETLLREAAEAYGVSPKAELWKLPARYVGPYAIQDAALPLDLLRRQERKIEEQDLWAVYDLESRVLPVLLRMKRRGVRIDLRKLDEIERWALAEEETALAAVRAGTGVAIQVGDVWKAAVVARAVKALGVKIPTTETGKPSLKADFVEKIDHPAAKALARARKVNKVRTTFVQSIRDHITGGDRIHCTFNQLKATREDGDPCGTVTGRLSSAGPNLQQQPARDPELGPMWRSIYIPEDGMTWAALDYSSQEPRMTVHFATTIGCVGAAAMAERFRKDPMTDLHQETATLCGIKRKDAKTIFLGLCYGMGGALLCRRLGLPTEWIDSRRTGKRIEVAGPEGQRLIDRFHQMVPFVHELSDRVQRKANRTGFIRTLSGRRCRFPVDEENSRPGRVEHKWLHKALNRLIQSSSADQTKTAMVEIDRAGFGIQLQVHDEIDLSVRNQAEADEIARIMETCIALEVPTKVDPKTAANWGKAK